MVRRAGRRNARGGGAIGSSLPTLYGVQFPTVADHYLTANPGGVPGSAVAGIWGAVLLSIDSQAVASRTRILGGRTDAATGWYFYTTGSNAAVRCDVKDPVNFKTTPTFTIDPSEISKAMLFAWSSDLTTLRGYARAVELGAGTATTGMTPFAGPQYLGRWSGGATAQDGVTIYGIAGGDGPLTAGEVTTLFAAVKTAGDIVAVPTKTTHLWSVKQDQAGSSPATLTDRAGADNMTRQGSPTFVSRRAAWGW